MKRNIRNCFIYFLIVLMIVAVPFPAAATPTLAAQSPVLMPISAAVLTATPGNGCITLQWKEAADKNGLDGYYLYKGTSPGGEAASPMFDFPVNALTYTDTLVTNGTTYYYIMKPCYDGGIRLGAASNEAYATPTANTGNTGTMVLTVGSPNMTVNGQTQEIDPGQGTAPVIHAASGRTFVPIRAIVETMGGTIAWDAAEKKVTIALRDKALELWIGKTTAMVNGTVKTLEIAPYISTTGRTMLPLRFIIENLGCEVVWNGPQKTIKIHYAASTGIPTHEGPPAPVVTPTPTDTPGTTGTVASPGTPVAADSALESVTPVSGGVIHTGRIKPGGETWTPNNGPHVVQGEFLVAGDSAPVLVIEAGTKVLFQAEASIIVGRSKPGGLMVNGTPAAPVLFAANTSTPHPGFWKGIHFSDKAVIGKSYIRNASIQSAGNRSNAYEGAITLRENTTGIELTNVKIKSSLSYGLHICPEAKLAENSTNVSILGTADAGGKGGHPIHTSLYGSDNLPAGGSFSGNFRNAIVVKGTAERVNDNFIWRNLGIPYAVMTNIHIGGSNNPVFTIEPGVVALFEQSRYIKVGQYGPGSIVADAQAALDGTAADISKSILETAQRLASSDAMLEQSLNQMKQNNIIVFGTLGRLTEKGVWSGIELAEGAIDGNVFNGCVISGAGMTSGSKKAALYASSSVAAQFKLAHTMITQSNSNGLELVRKAKLAPGAAGIYITNCNIPFSTSVCGAGSMGEGNEISGNTNDFIEIVKHVNGDEILSESAAWIDLGVPYMVKDPLKIQGSIQEVVLTLKEGVTLLFGNKGGFDIGKDGPGALKALGTLADPVTFTSVIKQAGSWDGLHFFSQMGPSCKLDFINLEFAKTGILLDALPGADILTNSKVQFCQKLGIDKQYMSIVDIIIDFLAPGLGNTFIGNGMDQN